MRMDSFRIKLVTGVLAIFAMAASQAGAVTIGFDPASQEANVGASIMVDVVVSDLGGEIVSAYDLDILYDASIVQPTALVFSNALGAGALTDAQIAAPGVLDVAGVSLLSDANLLALQGGDSVVLFTFYMDALDYGTSDLSFVLDVFNDVKGANNQILDIDPRDGSVGVVPEPSAALLFALGAVVVGNATGRRRGISRH